MSRSVDNRTRLGGDVVTVVVVGQTPPPLHGQAVMIDALVHGRMPGVAVHHVPMRFSRDVEEVGTVKLHKVLHLGEVVARLVAEGIRHRGALLYFPPAGPSLVAFARDAAILVPTRWMFAGTVLHFHAANLGALPRAARALFPLVYGRPTATIRISERSPRDDLVVGSQRDWVVPNGIVDWCAASKAPAPPVAERRAGDGDCGSTARPLHLLYVGALSETKGVLVLLRAAAELTRRGVDVQVTLAGEFRPAAFRAEVEALLAGEGLASRVRFAGVVSGSAKDRLFQRADLFCFPSFYEAENQSVAVMEAMMHGLPVVAAEWRAIADLVDDGATGTLVPVRDVTALAAAIERLARDPLRLRALGAAGRARFVERFTLDAHLATMARVFRSATGREELSKVPDAADASIEEVNARFFGALYRPRPPVLHAARALLSYDQRSKSRPLHRAVAPWLRAEIAAGRSVRVLDYGAGWGTFLFGLPRRACEPWAFDIVPEAVENVQRAGALFGHSIGAATVDDAGRISPGDFDLVVCSHVLEHVPDDAALARRLVEALRPGGVLLVNVPIHETVPDPKHARAYDLASARAVLEAAGAAVEQTWELDALTTFLPGGEGEATPFVSRLMRSSVAVAPAALVRAADALALRTRPAQQLLLLARRSLRPRTEPRTAPLPRPVLS